MFNIQLLMVSILSFDNGLFFLFVYETNNQQAGLLLR